MGQRMSYQELTVLLLGDDSSDFNLLRSDIESIGCEMVSFPSPGAAQRFLLERPAHMAICDLSLEGVDRFLNVLAEEYPEIDKVALFDGNDTHSLLCGLSQGVIDRVIRAPQKAGEGLSVIRRGLLSAELRQQNQTIQEEASQKSQEWVQLNKALEDKVQQRTEQILEANEQLVANYRSVVRMFSTLATRRLGVKASGDNVRLNKILVTVAAKAGVKEQELKQLYYAWQLRQIGKLSFSDELINVPYLKLTVDQQRVFHTHPLMAQAACLMVKPLYPAGKIILQHKEYLDGSGYPRGLKGEEISFRAQVLAVVNDYAEMIYGLFGERHYSTTEAVDYLSRVAAEKYNQDIVGMLSESVEQLSQSGDTLNDKAIYSDQLRQGMKLSRDLISGDGMLLLSADQLLDETAIERIREMEFNLDETFKVYVSQ